MCESWQVYIPCATNGFNDRHKELRHTNNYLGPVVRKMDSTINWINLYPVDGAIAFPNTYPLDGDLSSR